MLLVKLPDLGFSCRRVAAAVTPSALPTNASEVALPDITLPASLPGPNQYFDVETAAMQVAAGDVLLFTLSRAVDAYAGFLGVIRVSARLGG